MGNSNKASNREPQEDIANLFLGNKKVEQNIPTIHNESPSRRVIDMIVMDSSMSRVDIFYIEEEEDRKAYERLLNENVYSIQKEERFDKVVESTIDGSHDKVVSYTRIVDYHEVIISDLIKNLNNAIVNHSLPVGLAVNVFKMYSSSEESVIEYAEHAMKLYDDVFYKENKRLEQIKEKKEKEKKEGKQKTTKKKSSKKK